MACSVLFDLPVKLVVFFELTACFWTFTSKAPSRKGFVCWCLEQTIHRKDAKAQGFPVAGNWILISFLFLLFTLLLALCPLLSALCSWLFALFTFHCLLLTSD